MSRYFERGYRLMFGLNIGGLLRIVGSAVIVALPLIAALRLGISLPYTLIISGFYLLTNFLISLIAMREAGIGRIKTYYTASTIMMVESAIIDLALSLIKGRLIIMAGLLASLVPVSMLISLLKDPLGIRPILGYLIDLGKLFIIVVLIQSLTYLILGTITPSSVKLAGFREIFTIDLSLLLISVAILLTILAIHGFKGILDFLKMFGAYIYTMLTGDGSFMDFHLLKISKVADVNVNIVSLRDGGENYIVVPYLHTGPLSHVGGSELIPLLSSLAAELNVGIIYMHGVGGHEIDPASYDDTLIILDNIRKGINDLRESANSSVTRIRARPIVKVRSGNVVLTSIPVFNGKNIVLVSRLSKSMDDIPMSIYNEVLSRIKGVDDEFIVVDSQNSYTRDNSWDSGDVEDLVNGFRKLMEIQPIEDELRVWIRHIPKYAIPGHGSEIGDNGIYLVAFEFGGRRAMVVVIDGNNIRPELAERLRRVIEDRGYLAEVVTTDNHQYTGFLGKSGYNVVGDNVNHDALVRLIEDELNEVRLKTAKVGYIKLKSSIHVVGADGFYGMVKAAKDAVSITPIIAALLTIIPIVASVLITFIIP